jgi:hypothetical protein
MTEYLQLKREVNSDRLPENRETIVWRYMDDWKFADMLKRNQLYLCRGDKLQDRFEGTYSSKQIIDDDRYWKAETGSDKLNTEEKKSRQKDRRSWYINSWCMHDHDLYHMWQSYTNVCHAVAVQSRVANLVAICDAKEAIEFRHYQLSVSTVKYYNQKEGEFIDSLPTGFNPFVSKDHHFGLNNEIRILKWDPSSSKNEQTPNGLFMPVKLSALIERVVLSPGSTNEDIEKTKNLLTQYGLENTPVELSRYERELIE